MYNPISTYSLALVPVTLNTMSLVAEPETDFVDIGQVVKLTCSVTSRPQAEIHWILVLVRIQWFSTSTTISYRHNNTINDEVNHILRLREDLSRFCRAVFTVPTALTRDSTCITPNLQFKSLMGLKCCRME